MATRSRQYPELREELARNHKLKDDPRITRVGRLLRKASLDELPQLFNVLKREMSLVGPRMITPEEMDMYQEWGLNLLTVDPGITGLWQVSGRSDISYRERVELDMHYIRNWTIWLDLHVLIQTIPAVLKRPGCLLNGQELSLERGGKKRTMKRREKLVMVIEDDPEMVELLQLLLRRRAIRIVPILARKTV
jgi:lipopolysaccharide/colanic/teichoic acid biosynthesis glycosyltransferase